MMPQKEVSEAIHQQADPDPNVRLAAAKRLAELDLEESTEHMQHADIDTILIFTLQTDSDPQVRSATAEGLAVVELEQHSYHHQHDRLDDTLLKRGTRTAQAPPPVIPAAPVPTPEASSTSQVMEMPSSGCLTMCLPLMDDRYYSKGYHQ